MKIKAEGYSGHKTRRELYISTTNAGRGYRAIRAYAYVLDVDPRDSASWPTLSLRGVMQQLAERFEDAEVRGEERAPMLIVRAQDVGQAWEALQPALDDWRAWASTIDPKRVQYLERVAATESAKREPKGVRKILERLTNAPGRTMPRRDLMRAAHLSSAEMATALQWLLTSDPAAIEVREVQVPRAGGSTQSRREVALLAGYPQDVGQS